MSWSAKSKDDLMIEVWEKLDCESVGAAEIEAIETAVAGRYGRPAVDSPMVIARLLADEGADLRHSEIMALYLERAADRPYDAALRNILRLDSLQNALGSIRDLENLRQKFVADDDREGLRQLRETALAGKRSLLDAANSPASDEVKAMISREIAEWLSIWLQSPDIFESWAALRQRAGEFVEKFGKVRKDQR